MDNNNNNKSNDHKKVIHWDRFIIWIILIVIAVIFIIKINKTLMAFGMAFMIAYLLYPLVNLFSKITIPFIKKKMPWFVSILVVYTLLFAFLVVAGIILVPLTIDQVSDIVQDTPELAGKVQISFQSFMDKIEVHYKKLNVPADIEVKIRGFVAGGTAKIGNSVLILFKAIGNFLLEIISWVFFLMVAMIIAMFVLNNISDIKVRFYSWIPPDYQDDVKDLLAEINNIFGGYIRGYSILCFANGLLTYIITILILGILDHLPGFAGHFPQFRYNLIVSVIAGVTYFIPYLGAVLALVLGVILAFLQVPSFGYILVIGLVVCLTNQLIDRFLAPKILGDALGVSDLFIVFAGFAGGEILGVWGMIFGIPVAVMIQSILRYVHKRFLAFPVSEEILEGSSPDGKLKDNADSKDSPETPVKAENTDTDKKKE
jgi:predicted PurR-regulated permease PerM